MTQICVQFKVDRGDFDLDVAMKLPGTGVSALFGASGSGKTTCLRAIAGLERLPGSYLAVGETVWQDESKGIFVPPHKRDIGYVFQEASLFAHLNARENLLFGWRNLPLKQRKVSVEAVTKLLGLESLLDRPPARLSGGERQRVAIARALLTSPKLLLMDEPLSALDEHLKREILPYLERLHQELAIPIIYVSHSVDEVARLADHIVILQKGRVVSHGPIGEVMVDPHSGQLFGDGPSTLLQTRVRAHTEDHRTQLQGQGFKLWLSQQDISVGHHKRCRIYASDVSLTLSKPEQSSILNILPVTITQINPAKQTGEVLVSVALSDQQTLLVQISEHSRQALQLAPGVQAWAQIKSVALIG